MTASYYLPLVVLTPFMGAILAKWLSRFSRLHAAWTAGFVTLGALALMVPLIDPVFAGQVLVQQFNWIPMVGLNLAFRLDGLGLLFVLLILGIGLLIILYARYYLSENDDMGRFYAYLLLFMGSMLGIALSENILQLLIFWELTSLSSFLLISYWQQRHESRSGARMALTVTGAGGLALLGGFLLLGQIVGSYDLSVILVSGDLIRGHTLYVPMLVLVLLGAFTKSAQFPFHFWLPNAMAAPTPVSAYLHSATMVKAGVFLLARLFPALSGSPEWFWLVSITGLTTLVVAAYVAIFKHDLKGLLAYSTISHLGLITLLFGIGTPLAAVAAVFHIINHAIFKASLFMAAGIIDHETGTRDMRRLSGLWNFMPYTCLLAMVAAASMAGVPLFNGFLSKEMFFAETLNDINLPWGWILPAAATLAGIFAVTYSIRFIHTVFFNGEPSDLPKIPHGPPRWMKVPVEILVALCLLVGIFPSFTVEPILVVAATGMLQDSLPEYTLAIWHGFNTAFLMSVIALLGGLLLYLIRRPLFALHDRVDQYISFKACYEFLLNVLFNLSGNITQFLDTQSLQRMIFVFILFILSLGMANLDSADLSINNASLLPIDVISLLVGVLLMCAAVATVILHRQRFLALILIGAVGLGVVLIFIKFSAPDLALTQLSVEVVTIVLMLLALYFLPQQSPAESSRLVKIRDVIIASVVGSGVAILVWAVLTRPYESIADYFLANSVSGGGGSNVVNVILVDFRGYDTLGEITVLALAGLGIFAMLEHLSLSQSHHYKNSKTVWNQDMHPVIMASFARLLLPLALLVSIFILLRGHNLPGGGFIAGLITGVALITQYLANGVDWTQPRLPINAHKIIGFGLLIATLTGVASGFFNAPFLTSTFGHVDWPIVGEFELASAMVFDLGVYFVVVGTTLLILVNLGLVHHNSHHLNKRTH